MWIARARIGDPKGDEGGPGARGVERGTTSERRREKYQEKMKGKNRSERLAKQKKKLTKIKTLSLPDAPVREECHVMETPVLLGSES